jgi:hypothetical protein
VQLSSHPRAVADRLSIASSSLTHPRDIAIARQFVYEIEALAWCSRQQEARGETQKANAEFYDGRLTEESMPAEAVGPEKNSTSNRRVE